MRNRTLLLFLLFTILISCNSKKESSEIDLIKAYYLALNESQLSRVSDLFYDSIRMRENNYLYTASKDSFYLKLQWDSIFQPNYELLEIKEVDKGVEVKVSKTDPRILFLNEEPNINKELFTFKQGKIYSSEILEYIVFNWDLWDENRSKLVNWIQKNHPELEGFLHDQTKQGAINYLKVIKLYQDTTEKSR